MKVTGYKGVIVVLLAAGVWALQPVRAQITITADDIRGQARSTSYTDYSNSDPTGLAAIVAQTGNNKTWDMRAIQFTDTTVATQQIVTAPQPGSDKPAFATANLISKVSLNGKPDSVSYGYMRVQNDGLYLLGSHAVFTGTSGTEEISVINVPEYLAVGLPMTMGSSWVGTYKPTFDPPMGEGSIDFTFENTNEVIGWGTLRTPKGDAPALMVRSRMVSSFEVPPLPAFRDTSYSIDFYTKGKFSASIDLGPDGTPTGASFTEFSGGGVAAEDGADLPDHAVLEQNYPNPFNPATQIPFRLDQTGPVRLRVFDLLGREVATLVDGMMTAGDHQVRFDATSLPSGMYMYRLEANGTTQTRSMTLLK